MHDPDKFQSISLKHMVSNIEFVEWLPELPTEFFFLKINAHDCNEYLVYYLKSIPIN